MAGTSSKSGPSQRQLRVGELIRKVLAEVFLRGEIQDPDLDGALLSIAEVSVSPDLRNATVFVASLGDADDVLLLAALQRNRKFVRGLVARRVDLRYMPDLRFKMDDSLGQAERIDELLRSPKVARDLE